MDSPPEIVGRDAERASIEIFLEEPSADVALLLEGDIGIGKTTLWQEAIRLARERKHRILVSRPAEHEPRMAYSGLIDLLANVVDEATVDLPAPQRKALNIALLRQPANEPVESGAVAVALTGALHCLAGPRPLMLAIDDVQWLDTPSKRVLGFALRRRGSTPIRMIATQRSGFTIADTLAAIPTLRMQLLPLTMASTYQLVRTKLGVALPRPALARIYETSAGNAFFALELARGLIEGDDKAMIRPLPVPQRLNDLLHQRLAPFEGRTRQMLLVAAALGTSSVHDLEEVVGFDVEKHLFLAEQAGVLDSRDGSVSFTHPLLAAAIYDGASSAERRAIHRDLANKVVEPEARAAHLGLCTTHPDEDIATALDTGARSAAARGATDVAANLAERAVELTAVSSLATRRAIDAGTYAMAAGDRSRARSLFHRALRTAGVGTERAEALLLLAKVAEPLSDGVALCDQALQEAGTSQAIPGRIHRTRAAIAYFLGDVPSAERDARLAVELAEEGDDPATLGMALAEWAHWIYCGGGGIRRDLFERAVALDGSAAALSPRSHFAKALMDDDDLEDARERLSELLEESMRNGMVHSATSHYAHLGELELWAGDWTLAIHHAEESLQLGEHMDRPSAPLYVKAMAHACLGNMAEADRSATLGLEEAQRSEDVVYAMQNLHVLGFTQLSLGNHDRAFEYLDRATRLLQPRWNKEFGDCHVVPDAIEAALGCGEIERAEELAAWMEDVGRRGRAWTRATAARSRALVRSTRRDLPGALAAIEEAVAAHRSLPMPLELARTHLVHGVILRRLKRRAAAREALEKALGLCEPLGAALWSARTRAEMARLGVRHAAQTDLTPVEERIALLVTEGHTNREIATALSISPKTVEANLTRIFRKLNVRSRTELAVRTADRPIDTAATGR